MVWGIDWCVAESSCAAKQQDTGDTARIAAADAQEQAKVILSLLQVQIPGAGCCFGDAIAWRGFTMIAWSQASGRPSGGVSGQGRDGGCSFSQHESACVRARQGSCIEFCSTCDMRRYERAGRCFARYVLIRRWATRDGRIESFTGILLVRRRWWSSRQSAALSVVTSGFGETLGAWMYEADAVDRVQGGPCRHTIGFPQRQRGQDPIRRCICGDRNHQRS